MSYDINSIRRSTKLFASNYGPMRNRLTLRVKDFKNKEKLLVIKIKQDTKEE